MNIAVNAVKHVAAAEASADTVDDLVMEAAEAAAEATDGATDGAPADGARETGRVGEAQGVPVLAGGPLPSLTQNSQNQTSGNSSSRTGGERHSKWKAFSQPSQSSSSPPSRQ